MASDADQGLSTLSRVSLTIAVLVSWGARKYYAGKVRAEITALGKVGGERLEGFSQG
jgi:hypothetical protein